MRARRVAARRARDLVTTAVTIVLLLSSGSAAQSHIAMATVLDRLHSYLADYAERLPATIASEHYVQRAGTGVQSQVSTLDSDFGIIRLPGVHEWLGFRDVLLKDGKAVSDHERRLDTIFRNPSVTALEQARLVTEESARHNVGPIYRTINSPALVLELLDSRNSSRMRFTKSGEETIGQLRAWVIRFEETSRPTIVRAINSWDAPAKGRAWIDPATGRLMRAEAAVHAPGGAVRTGDFTGTVSVTFSNESRLGFWVPTAMTETYETTRLTMVASGEATYSNYRIFTVDTRVIVNP
jgi:hypothetical protein